MSVPFATEIYLNLLSDVLAPCVFQGIQSIYDAAVAHKARCSGDVLRLFQDLLKNVVPSWSKETLEGEVTRIKQSTRMGQRLPKLFRAVCEGYTICCAHGRFNLEDPENVLFSSYVHRVYVQVAREFYQNPYLYQHNVSPRELKENQRTAVRCIREAIKGAVIFVLPVDKMLDLFIEGGEPTAPAADGTRAVSVPTGAKPPAPLLQVSLLDPDGVNVADRVFTAYNIQESVPRLLEGEVSENLLSNFLRAPPRLSVENELVQSPISELDFHFRN